MVFKFKRAIQKDGPLFLCPHHTKPTDTKKAAA